MPLGWFSNQQLFFSMPFYRLCQVKMLGQKHGTGIRTRWWRNRSLFLGTSKDGHEEAEGSLRGSFTQRLNLFYGWRYLWGLPFRWRNNLSRSQKQQLWAVRQFLKCGSTCQESDLDTDLDTMHFITDNKVRSQNGSSLWFATLSGLNA